jgi:hypothetical protein
LGRGCGHQDRAEGRRTGRRGALILPVVVVFDEVACIAQRLWHARAGHHVAVAGQLAQHHAERARQAAGAIALGLAVDRHFGVIRPQGLGDVALGAQVGLGQGRSRRHSHQQREKKNQTTAH